MNIINTRSWKKTLLNQFVLDDNGDVSLYVLFILGVVAGIMHVHLRWPLNIPGHHGVEWMALLLFGRMQSNYRWSGLVIAGGAAMTYLIQVPFFPLAHTFKPALIYLLNGVCLDMLIRYTPVKLPVIIKGVILGGVSYMAKPVLLMLMAMMLELKFGSFLKYGYYYPVLTHFLFGAVGGITGITLASVITSRKKNQID